MQERNTIVDHLRGIAMLAMILIHTNAYYLSNKTASVIWNYLQFAVPIFVFCSLYLFISKYDFSGYSWSDLKRFYAAYLPKRAGRLLLPYYIFLPFFLIVLFIIDKSSLTPMYILKSLTLTGGVDINWLVLLFLQITFLSPFFLFITQKSLLWKRIVVIGIIFFLFVSIFPFIRSQLPDYRWIMWIGWSYLFFVTWDLIHKKRRVVMSAFLAIPLSGVLYFLYPLYSQLYAQKYPPTLFFILYGVLWIVVLYVLLEKFQLPKVVNHFLHYLSVKSYSLYFIHYCLLVLLSPYVKYLKWYTFFPVILFSSLFVQWGYDTWRKYVRVGKVE